MTELEPIETFIAQKNEILAGDGLVNFFELLDVPEDASTELIQQGYFQAVKQIHPDRLDQIGGGELKPKAAKLFQDFTEAYEMLKGIKTRLEHLRSIEAHREGRPDVPSEDQARIFAHRGSAMMARRDFAQAERFFRKSLSSRETDLEVQLDLAWAIFHNEARSPQQRAELTRKSIEETLRGRPGHARALYYMAMVCKVEGDFRREARFLNQCLGVDPNYLDALREQRLLNMRLKKTRKSSFMNKIKKMLKKR